jgi:hypothetical protein
VSTVIWLGPEAENRTKGLYGLCANIPTERDPIRGAIISVAWRYSWAIFTRRARRAGVSALRASLSSTQRIFRIVSPKAYSWYANNTDICDWFRRLVCEPALSPGTTGQGVIGPCSRTVRDRSVLQRALPHCGASRSGRSACALQPDARAGKRQSSTRGARHLCPLTDKVEQILAVPTGLPELLTGRRITRLLGAVM